MIGRLDGIPATACLEVGVLLIFGEVNLVYISCTYLSAIDTRMKINFGQVWCPEADCSSSCYCTWGLGYELKYKYI